MTNKDSMGIDDIGENDDVIGLIMGFSGDVVGMSEFLMI